MDSEVYAAVITAGSGILAAGITAWFGWKKAISERHKRMTAEREMRFSAAALSFEDFVSEWSHAESDLTDLMQQSRVDRFLLLRAWNGYADPRWTTAFYQVRMTGQKPYSYQHFELDDHYQRMLRDVMTNRRIVVKTDEMPDCALKAIYQTEGVTGAAIFLVGYEELRDGEKKDVSKAITYCSFATHHEGGLTETDVTLCRIFAGRLKGLKMAGT